MGWGSRCNEAESSTCSVGIHIVIPNKRLLHYLHPVGKRVDLMRCILAILILFPLIAIADPQPQSVVEANYQDATKCAYFSLRFGVPDYEEAFETRNTWFRALRHYRPVSVDKDFIFGPRYFTREEVNKLHAQEAGPALLSRYREIVRHCQLLADDTLR